MSDHRPPDNSAIARLFAGGHHVRLLIAGQPPSGLSIPVTKHFERVVHLARRDQQGPIIADPTRMPFTEALFDRALVTTPLPASDARVELREVWRTLAPAGLVVLVVKARRPWQVHAPGWVKDRLEPVIEAAMFEVLDWQIATLPGRHHLILVAKRDGLRPAMIGRVEAVAVPVTA